MKRILLLVSFVLVSALFRNVEVNAQEPQNKFVEIPVKHDPAQRKENVNNKGPRVPAYVPVKAYLMGDCLSIVCEYDVSGTIEVLDNYTNMVVAVDTITSDSGIDVELSEYHEGRMELQLYLNEVKYIGYF